MKFIDILNVLIVKLKSPQKRGGLIENEKTPASSKGWLEGENEEWSGETASGEHIDDVLMLSPSPLPPADFRPGEVWFMMNQPTYSHGKDENSQSVKDLGGKESLRLERGSMNNL